MGSKSGTTQRSATSDSSKGKAATGNPPYKVAAPFATPKATMSLVP